MSKKELDRLGDRLRDAPVPAEEDLRLLESVRPHYLAALRLVRLVLVDELGLSVTQREKNRDTIIEKLRRERDMRLSRTQDIVGARVVRDMTLAEQDELCGRVAARLPGHLLRDRRATPSYGYRAVHLIAKVDGLPVEIQVRTAMQHDWAQSMERLGDNWGRAVRYGGSPAESERLLDLVPGGVPKPRQFWVDLLKDLSQHIASAEASAVPRVMTIRVEGVPGDLTLHQLLKSFLFSRL